ncbi:MAG: YlxR family protein [Armatimonadetes bacterium]|nr:YlxR family protein [Armatimonadota bacterium]
MPHQPLRTCTGCRTTRLQAELLRLARTLEGSVVLDPGRRVAGRGADLCPNPECLALAVKRRALDRAFRGTVPRDALLELNDRLHAFLRERGRLRDGSSPEVEDGTLNQPR